MKTLLDELRKRREHLSTLRFGSDQGRLLELLTWLEAQQEINSILVELRAAVEVEPLISLHGFPPKTSSQKEVAAIGLYMMDKTRDGSALWETAMEIHVRPRHPSRNPQDYIDEAMTCYVNPFLDYVEADLETLGNGVTVESAAGLRFNLFNDPGFLMAFPGTHLEMRKIAEYCGQAEEAGSWFHVGTSCREAMGTFVRELQTHQKVVPSPELKQGDVKGILKQLAKERSADELLNLIQAIWSYNNAIVHRQAATKQDALRAYLWTGLLVSEICLLVGPL